MSQSNRTDATPTDLEVTPEAGAPGEAQTTEISNDELSNAAGGVIDKKWILPYVDQV